MTGACGACFVLYPHGESAYILSMFKGCGISVPFKPCLPETIVMSEQTAVLAARPYLMMNGLGNEILVVDLRTGGDVIPAEEARRVGAWPKTPFDQMMVLYPPKTTGTDAFMRIYNTDGSLSGACGNGTRCVAWYMMRDGDKDALVLETKAGLVSCVRAGPELFTVDMGEPKLKWEEIPLSEPFADTRMIELQVGPIDAPVMHSPAVVNMGNPHAIFFVDDMDAIDLGRVGPLLENHPLFPERANISVAQVMSRGHIRLKVWERGAGLTRACGTAACATVVAGVRKRLTNRDVAVQLPGGTLNISWREADKHVLMTGPIELEHEGVFPPELFAARVG